MSISLLQLSRRTLGSLGKWGSGNSASNNVGARRTQSMSQNWEKQGYRSGAAASAASRLNKAGTGYQSSQNQSNSQLSRGPGSLASSSGSSSMNPFGASSDSESDTDETLFDRASNFITSSKDRLSSIYHNNKSLVFTSEDERTTQIFQKSKEFLLYGRPLNPQKDYVLRNLPGEKEKNIPPAFHPPPIPSEDFVFTFGKYKAYNEYSVYLFGDSEIQKRLKGQDPMVTHLKKEIKILEAMRPHELESNDRRVFSLEDKRLIAEKAETTVIEVEKCLDSHDRLRADRRWYMILSQFNREHPKDFHDRFHMAMLDRPRSTSENFHIQNMQDRSMRTMKDKRPSRHRTWVYRAPSKGGNRWSIQPPKWYPRMNRVEVSGSKRVMAAR